MTRRIFIDNYGPETTRETLEALFRISGPVESVNIPPTVSIKETVKHAFVVMMDSLDAAKAIDRLNNTDWNGSRLTVTFAGPITRVSKGFGGGTPRLSVGNKK